jgi:hypothetical protein
LICPWGGVVRGAALSVGRRLEGKLSTFLEGGGLKTSTDWMVNF